jgi:hypothetical protein
MYYKLLNFVKLAKIISTSELISFTFLNIIKLHFKISFTGSLKIKLDYIMKFDSFLIVLIIYYGIYINSGGNWLIASI